MSKDQSATTTRREFLGAATAVTAASLASPATSEAQESDPQRTCQRSTLHRRMRKLDPQPPTR